MHWKGTPYKGSIRSDLAEGSCTRGPGPVGQATARRTNALQHVPCSAGNMINRALHVYWSTGLWTGWPTHDGQASLHPTDGVLSSDTAASSGTCAAWQLNVCNGIPTHGPGTFSCARSTCTYATSTYTCATSTCTKTTRSSSYYCGRIVFWNGWYITTPGRGPPGIPGGYRTPVYRGIPILHCLGYA